MYRTTCTVIIETTDDNNNEVLKRTFKNAIVTAFNIENGNQARLISEDDTIGNIIYPETNYEGSLSFVLSPSDNDGNSNIIDEFLNIPRNENENYTSEKIEEPHVRTSYDDFNDLRELINND